MKYLDRDYNEIKNPQFEEEDENYPAYYEDEDGNIWEFEDGEVEE